MRRLGLAMGALVMVWFFIGSAVRAAEATKPAATTKTIDEAVGEVQKVIQATVDKNQGKEEKEVKAAVCASVMEYARKNQTNNGGPVGLLILAGMNEDNPAEQRRLLEGLVKRYPTSELVAPAKQKLAELKEIGTPAKDFTTVSLAGKEVKLKDFRGKVVLIDFFASWCGPCRAEMPNLVKLYGKYNAQGLEILGVSLDQNAAAAQKYVTEAGMKWTVTYQQGSPVANLYGVQAIPMTYLLDKNGNILASGLRGAALERKLEELFPAKPVAPKATTPAGAAKKK